MDPPADQTAGEIYGNKAREYGGERSVIDAVWGYCVEKTPAP